jgi:hypothetical protein
MLKAKALGIQFSILIFCALPAALPAAPAGFGMVPYWGDLPGAYAGQIPKGAYVVINPDSGALKLSSSVVSNYKAIIKSIRDQGGKVLGYVPTGYAQLKSDEQQRYNAISDNLKAYKSTLGGVDGFFFDEAAAEGSGVSDKQACANTVTKWPAVRSKMSGAGVSGVVVWNTGWSGDGQCYIATAKSGEHVVVLEDSYKVYQANAAYLNQMVQKQADSRGVKTWVLLHSATQSNMKTALNETTASYVYVTSVMEDKSKPWGGPIWNSTPSYWGNETKSGSERWCFRTLAGGGSCS